MLTAFDYCGIFLNKQASSGLGFECAKQIWQHKLSRKLVLCCRSGAKEVLSLHLSVLGLSDQDFEIVDFDLASLSETKDGARRIVKALSMAESICMFRICAAVAGCCLCPYTGARGWTLSSMILNAATINSQPRQRPPGPWRCMGNVCKEKKTKNSVPK